MNSGDPSTYLFLGFCFGWRFHVAFLCICHPFIEQRVSSYAVSNKAYSRPSLSFSYQRTSLRFKLDTVGRVLHIDVQIANNEKSDFVACMCLLVRQERCFFCILVIANTKICVFGWRENHLCIFNHKLKQISHELHIKHGLHVNMMEITAVEDNKIICRGEN